MERNDPPRSQVIVVESVAAANGGREGSRPAARSRRAADEELSRLYDDHCRRLTGLAAAITLDRSAARDLVHEAFAGLTARFDSVRSPEPYLQRSVVNLSIDHVRQRERSRSLPRQPIEPTAIPEIDEAWALVGELPAHQRAVVVLRFWEDLTQEQIADVLAIPLGTVKSTLHRGLRTLRQHWPSDFEEER